MYRELKTALVLLDDEGNWCVKTQTQEGEQLNYKLDLRRATQLNEQLAVAVSDMIWGNTRGNDGSNDQ